jgi:hypothetical protein
MKKRGHHYVWQHYLKSWSNHSQLYCLRHNKIFPSNTKNIGKKRDFYKLKCLSEKEIDLLKSLIKPMSQNELKNIHEGWLDIFVSFSSFNENAVVDYPKKLEDRFHNIEEDLMSKIETDALEALKLIQNKNIYFQKNDRNYYTFLIFLAIQYVRTNKMKSNMNEINFGEGINRDNIWSVLKYNVATNIAHSIFSHRFYKLVLIENDSNEALITGDQPVINIASGGMYEKEASDVELYYPISPKLAILITNKYDHTVKYIEADEVKYYNSAIYKHSHEQVYAASKETLEALLQTYK